MTEKINPALVVCTKGILLLCSTKYEKTYYLI